MPNNITPTMKKKLEAKGYGVSGSNVTKNGKAVGGVRDDGNIWSGSSVVTSILRPSKSSNSSSKSTKDTKTSKTTKTTRTASPKTSKRPSSPSTETPKLGRGPQSGDSNRKKTPSLGRGFLTGPPTQASTPKSRSANPRKDIVLLKAGEDYPTTPSGRAPNRKSSQKKMNSKYKGVGKGIAPHEVEDSTKRQRGTPDANNKIKGVTYSQYAKMTPAERKAKGFGPQLTRLEWISMAAKGRGK